MESQCQTDSPISNLIDTEGPRYGDMTGASIAIFAVSQTLRHLVRFQIFVEPRLLLFTTQTTTTMRNHILSMSRIGAYRSVPPAVFLTSRVIVQLAIYNWIQ